MRKREKLAEATSGEQGGWVTSRMFFFGRNCEDMRLHVMKQLGQAQACSRRNNFVLYITGTDEKNQNISNPKWSYHLNKPLVVGSNSFHTASHSRIVLLRSHL
jgi:hypothetical protein